MLYKKEWFFFIFSIIAIYGCLYLTNYNYSIYFMNPDNEASINLVIALLLVLSFFLKIIKNKTLNLMVDFFTVFITMILAYKSIPESKHISINTSLFVVCTLLPVLYVYVNILAYGVRLTNKLEKYYKQKNRTTSNISKSKSEDSCFSIPAKYMEKIELNLNKNEGYEYFFHINIENELDYKKLKQSYNLLSRFYTKKQLEFKLIPKKNKIEISWPVVEADD